MGLGVPYIFRHGVERLRLVWPVAAGGEARTLHREHKTIGHLARPFAPRLGLLRTIISAVDLVRGQLGSRVFQLLRLRQLLRIKHPAPRREGPAADADINMARFFRSSFGNGGLAHREVSRSLGRSNLAAVGLAYKFAALPAN